MNSRLTLPRRRTIDDWKDVQSLYPRIADLLKVESIQRSVFEGLVLSLGGKNMTTVRDLSH